jgi:hypothetical protein
MNRLSAVTIAAADSTCAFLGRFSSARKRHTPAGKEDSSAPTDDDHIQSDPSKSIDGPSPATKPQNVINVITAETDRMARISDLRYIVRFERIQRPPSAAVGVAVTVEVPCGIQ